MSTFRSFVALSLFAFLFFAPQVKAQSASASGNSSKSAGVVAATPSTDHYLWTEEFSGSSNSEGRVMSLDSAVGYVFSPHVGIDAGIPIYFVRASSTTLSGTTTNTSSNGFGDAYLQLRLAFSDPLLDYKTALTGTVPTGDTSTGLSTGHATYDWTNHFDRAFGSWTPFAEIGIGNSIPSTFIFNRPYESFGHDAHFQAGVTYDVIPWLSVSASAYDVSPWGTQTIFSRIVGKGGPPVGVGGHGRVFNVSNQTTGGASIAADNGFSAGANFSPGGIVDFSADYSHSVYFQLDTFSFSIGLNMSKLLRRARTGI